MAHFDRFARRGAQIAHSASNFSCSVCLGPWSTASRGPVRRRRCRSPRRTRCSCRSRRAKMARSRRWRTRCSKATRSTPALGRTAPMTRSFRARCTTQVRGAHGRGAAAHACSPTRARAGRALTPRRACRRPNLRADIDRRGCARVLQGGDPRQPRELGRVEPGLVCRQGRGGQAMSPACALNCGLAVTPVHARGELEWSGRASSAARW